MPKKNQSTSMGNVESQTPLGSQVIKALTESEISQLFDVLFATLSEEQRLTALAQLQPNTQETLSQIMTSSQTVEQTTTSKAPLTSLAKAAQTWSELWQEWYDIIEEAAQEEGKYIAQEERWEEPYFDTYTLVEDLEEVAERMKPLVKSAFKNGFNHDDGFALLLLEAESEISNGIPEWMDIHDGIDLEPAITNCLLHWEWLSVQEEGENGFRFVQKIREWEEKFSYVVLEEDTLVEFCLELPDTQKQLILTGMTASKESSMWKQVLENAHSPWHQFYMEAIQSYAPEQYIDNVRETIPQQWENGLIVIEDLLVKRQYQESLAAIQETFNSLLQRQQAKNPWAPETSLLYTILGGFHYGPERWGDEKTLLDYYQQTVQKLGETERVNALEIQQIAFDFCANWSSMFKAFTDIPVSENTRQALFESWRQYIIDSAKPEVYYQYYTTAKTVDTWWLHWLLDSIVAHENGATWFQQQITQWLNNLSGDKTDLGEEYDVLRLLTKDLAEIHYKGKPPYPKFYQVVIRPKDLSAPDDASRRTYLQQYAPTDLWERVITYWKTHLKNLVPKPEDSQGSDYTQHGQWMTALLELAPDDYNNLLQSWKVAHLRRRNLWKVMDKLGMR